MNSENFHQNYRKQGFTCPCELPDWISSVQKNKTKNNPLAGLSWLLFYLPPVGLRFPVPCFAPVPYLLCVWVFCRDCLTLAVDLCLFAELTSRVHRWSRDTRLKASYFRQNLFNTTETESPALNWKCVSVRAA